MKPSHTVCELHFEKKFIEDSYEIKVQNIHLKEKRGKKRLTEDAVPTIFEGYPSYMQMRAPLKRKPPAEKKQIAPKHKKNEATRYIYCNLKIVVFSSLELS